MLMMKRGSSMVRKALGALIATALMVLNSMNTVYAKESIKDSKIIKGTEELIKDVTTWLMITAPVIAGLFIIYFCVRRSAADEMDIKKWDTRIVVAIVSCIGAVLGAATLNVIISYYK